MNPNSVDVKCSYYNHYVCTYKYLYSFTIGTKLFLSFGQHSMCAPATLYICLCLCAICLPHLLITLSVWHYFWTSLCGDMSCCADISVICDGQWLLLWLVQYIVYILWYVRFNMPKLYSPKPVVLVRILTEKWSCIYCITWAVWEPC